MLETTQRRYAELYSEDECDALLRMVMNPPMISRREVYLRRVIARDFPEPGCRTHCRATQAILTVLKRGRSVFQALY